MTNHHDAFKAFAPIDWDQIPLDDLKQFLNDTFDGAQTVIESVPSPASAAGRTLQRARAQTDSAIDVGEVQRSVAVNLSAEASSQAQQLRKEWKEVKVNPRENPLGINVYKLASKDGNGAWFARRSVHESPSFDLWKLGLQKELVETLPGDKPLGAANIRGIGAEKRVEHHVVPDAGYLDVFQLYAQFPGPTSPRDFITLLLGSDPSQTNPDQPRQPRQFMIISRPCNHPETPPRQGIIRGQYESVELIREIPPDNSTAKRTLSATDLSADGGTRSSSASGRAHSTADATQPMLVEWLMVTRSDPGGSVPRFMIERGTPPGIVNDAGKFVKWLSSKSTDDLSGSTENAEIKRTVSNKGEPLNGDVKLASEVQGHHELPGDNEHNITMDNDAFNSNSGLYGMITGAFGAASSMATGLRRQLVGPAGANDSQASVLDTNVVPEEDEDGGSTSDASSTGSFTSALERGTNDDPGPESAEGSRSDETKSQSNNQEDKELKRLEDRRRRLEEKAAKMQERMEQKRQEDKARDEASWAKAREKHDKEIAKQEAKLQRELKRLEEKREQERRKAEERKRKAAEREEKGNIAVELEKTRAERDLALQEIKLLQSQVGDLQHQNTMLVAKLGRLGVDTTPSSSSPDLTANSSHKISSPASS